MYGGAADFALRSRQLTFFKGQITYSADVGWDFYPLTFLWRTTPLVLLGLGLAIPAYIFQWGIFERKETRQLVAGALLFVLLFYILMQFGDKKYDRYLLPVFPFLNMLAALGWVGSAAMLAVWLPKIHARLWSNYLPIAVVLLVALGQLAFSVEATPYYMSYYNPLFGGRKKAPEVMNIGWGEGYDQAAAYLNAKPDAGQLRAIAAMGYGAFSFYFNGQAGWFDISKIEEIDYIVVYIEHRQKRIPEAFFQVLDQIEPEKTIIIKDIPYIDIYNQQQFTPEMRRYLIQSQTD
jgi:hypothetical protein